MLRRWLLTSLFFVPVFAQSGTRADVKSPSFRGRLYRPSGQAKPLAVLLIGGSEGHLYAADEIGPQLVAAGFTVLGIDYHDGHEDGRKLSLIPIETFTAGVAFLQRLPEHQAVAVLGASRGSEAALLTGIYDHGVVAVAAFVPSSVLWRSTETGFGPHHAAWTWQGKPLPCVSCDGGQHSFNWYLDDTGQDAKARIAVEQIQAPIFLAGSDGDGLWPSGRMTRELDARLRKNDFKYATTIVIYPAANHRLLGPSPLGARFDSRLGGTASGSDDARKKAWAALLVFLNKAADAAVPVGSQPDK